MSNKITLTELADILSVNSKLMSKKSDWENFLRLLFAEISDALYKDKVVKVKGLGTFKLVMVEPRKSVNIKTGEAVIIPSHAKISYTPDSTLAAVINKPYSHLEVTTLSPNGPVDPEEKEDLENDIIAEETKEATEEITTEHKVQTAVDPTLPTGIQRASEKIAEAIEKINSISENNVSAVEDAPKDEEQATEDTVPATEEATHSDENVSDSTQEEENKEEEKKREEVRTETAAEQEQKNEGVAVDDAAPLPTSPIVEDKPAESSKSNSKKLGFALVIIVAFIGIFAAILWMSDPNIVNKIRAKINGGTEPAKTEATTVVPADTAQTTIKEDTVASAIKDSLIKDITEEAAAETATPAAEDNETAQKPYIENKKIHFREDFVKYMKANHPSVDLGSDSENEEEIGKGDRLTLVSLRNYGQKDFWVYLYLYNYDKIKNPNNVRPGTKILIPALSSSLVNPDSEESINLAREIKAHFIKN